jgi:hypothetical protein
MLGVHVVAGAPGTLHRVADLLEKMSEYNCTKLSVCIDQSRSPPEINSQCNNGLVVMIAAFQAAERGSIPRYCK